MLTWSCTHEPELPLGNGFYCCTKAGSGASGSTPSKEGKGIQHLANPGQTPLLHGRGAEWQRYLQRDGTGTVLSSESKPMNHVTIGLHPYADTLDCIAYFLTSLTEAHVRYDLVCPLCTIRSRIPSNYDTISRFFLVRYQSRSHCYYDT